MDPATFALLTRLIVVPVIIELLERRGAKVVTADEINNILTADAGKTEKMLKPIMDNIILRKGLVDGLADVVDGIASEVIDAAADIFKALTTGKEDDT